MLYYSPIPIISCDMFKTPTIIAILPLSTFITYESCLGTNSTYCCKLTTIVFVFSTPLSRSSKVDFVHFYFSLFYFSFSFFILLYFLFLEQLGLGVISHAVTSVTNWWCSHKTDHGTWEKEVEDSGTKWRHIAWTTHAGLM